MNEDVDIGDARLRIGEDQARAIQHGLLGLRRRRQHLACAAKLADVENDIGERATDIDGQPDFGSFKHSIDLRNELVDELSKSYAIAPAEMCLAALHLCGADLRS